MGERGRTGDEREGDGMGWEDRKNRRERGSDGEYGMEGGMGKKGKGDG